MCLLILQPSGTEIPDEYLLEGFQSNNDGAGFAWADGQRCWSRKGYFNAKDFLRDYKEIAGKGMPILVHFRMATHGSEDHVNCHPFDAGGGWYMGHNGILTIKVIGTESDTAAFARTIRPVLERDSDILRVPAMQEMLEQRIGSANKLAFLRYDGEYVIVNESAGHWEKGVWFSNHSYLKTGFGCYRGGSGYSVYESYWEHEMRKELEDERVPTPPAQAAPPGKGYWLTVTKDGKETRTWVSLEEKDSEGEARPTGGHGSWVDQTYARMLRENAAAEVETAGTGGEVDGPDVGEDKGSTGRPPCHFIEVNVTDVCVQCNRELAEGLAEDRPIYVDPERGEFFCFDCACDIGGMRA